MKKTFKNMIKWAESNFFEFVISLFISLDIIGIGSLLFVHFLSPHVQSEISADGILSYLGTIISTVGSVVVAVVAVWQSKKSNDIAKRSTELAQQSQNIAMWHYQMDIQPFVLVAGVRYEKMTYADLLMCNDISIYEIDHTRHTDSENRYLSTDVLGVMWVEMVNTTDSLVSIQFDEMVDKTGLQHRLSMNNNAKIKTVIPNQDKRLIGFYSSENYWNQLDFSDQEYTFILENRFGERYKEKFVMIVGYSYIIEKSDTSQKDIFYSARGYNVEKC